MADAVGVGLEAHGLAHLVGPGDVLGPGLDVRQDLAGGGLQVRKAQLGQVPLDGLLLAVDVRVGSPQAGRDLPDARDDVLGLQGLVAAAVGAGRGEHVSVLLQVDRGPEQVVPDRKPEGPVAPELRLHAPLHGGGPGVNVHLGRAALAPGARWGRGRKKAPKQNSRLQRQARRLSRLLRRLSSSSWATVFRTSGQAVPRGKQKQKATAK